MASVTQDIFNVDPISKKFPDLGSIIGGTSSTKGILAYIYVIAGLILLIMLIVGGITLMTAAGDQNKTKQGYGMISSGLIGFLIIFVSYFVAQVVQVALGVKFL
jgi:uncharacterized membrane protein